VSGSASPLNLLRRRPKVHEFRIDAMGGPVVLVGQATAGPSSRDAGNGSKRFGTGLHRPHFLSMKVPAVRPIEQACLRKLQSIQPDSNGELVDRRDQFVGRLAADIPPAESHYMLYRSAISTDSFHP